MSQIVVRPTTATVTVNTETSVVTITPIAQGQEGPPGPSGGVDSVTGDGVGGTATNVVMTFPTVDEIGAYSNTNPSAFVNAAGAASAAPVQSVNDETGNVSVYAGGTTGDILTKVSATDYDTAWTDDIVVDSLSYDTTANITPSTIGETAWNADVRTVTINKGNGVLQNITQDLNYPPCRNATVTTLNRGELVMVDPAQPAQGQTLRVVRYVSNGTYPVDLFVGMVIESIAPNATGFVEWFGQVRELDLSTLQPVGETWAEGDILWPNPSVVGGMTKTEPTAPNHKLTAAAVLRINGNSLDLLVRPNLRSKLSDLHDVQVTNVQTNEVLKWNGSVWTNDSDTGTGVQSVTGDGVSGTSTNVVMTFPTVNQIGAYSNTNPDNFINSGQAPVQSVNGQTGIVMLALHDIDDVNVAGVTNNQSLVYNADSTTWEARTISGSSGAVDSVNGQTGAVVLDADDVGAYSNTNPNNFINAAQVPIKTVTGDGVDNTNVGNVVISYPTIDDIGAYSNTNPDNFVDAAGAAAAAPVQSVNGDTGIVVITANSIGAYLNTNPNNFVNSAQAAAVAPIQSVTGTQVTGTSSDPVIDLPTLDQIGAYSNTNPDGFITSAEAPVQSVNGLTGTVVLDPDDIGAYSNTNPNNFINTAQASAAAPIQSVTGTLVTGTASDPVIDIPTLDQVGAYSNTNPNNFINSAQAPVQSVNGLTGVVVLDADDIGAYSNTNPNNFINSAQAPVQSVFGRTGAIVAVDGDYNASNITSQTFTGVTSTNVQGALEQIGSTKLTALQTISDKTSNYTFAIADSFSLLTMSNSSNSAFTIPQEANVAFSNGVQIDIMRKGSGNVFVLAETNVVLRAPLGTTFRAQNSVATAIKIGTNDWLVTGDMST